MRDVGDLYSLACSENEANWQMNIKPNIHHIIVSILNGVAYLHSKGYLHRDLKGKERGERKRERIEFN